ncbi:MAG: RNase adapter RapZ [Bdellovibrionota bacterium]
MQANRLVIITGMSGSGKSIALNVFEDMGYFCVDNLPAPLIANFADFLINIPEEWSRSTDPVLPRGAALSDANPGSREWRFALRVDCREEASFPDVSRAIERLRAKGTEVTLLFFDCFDEILIQRFRETRRPHPILLVNPQLKTLGEALTRERELLSEFRGGANRIIDTSSFSPHDLRRVVEGFFRHEAALEVVVHSFGFKFGVPFDADLIIDVRFLPNPHFVSTLRDKTGFDESVRDFVFQNPDTEEFLKRYLALLEFLLPRYQQEGKRYLSIGVGCTGGRHRSVAVALRLAEELDKRGTKVAVRHRDVERRHNQ